MAKYEVYHQDAMNLYLEGKTLEEISKIIPVSIRSLSIWKQENEWEEKRRRYRLEGSGGVEILERKIIDFINKMEEGAVTAESADTLTKLIKSLRGLEKERDMLGMALAVMKRFAQFVKERFSEKSEIVAAIIRDFFTQLEKER
ncbi:MAG: DUF1804 family protein [Candidatus Latescibacterota bacterium]|jgi:uncharacterized protein YjcR|nr:MAG: DUF1804 family protein [Candidatus Latescibacterota bacterium]